MDIEVKEKQIKKYKFLQILHDYGTTADEILDKAANPKRNFGRGSTILPQNSNGRRDLMHYKNQSSGEFPFFKSNTNLEHRNSDLMYGVTKPLLATLKSNNSDLNNCSDRAAQYK